MKTDMFNIHSKKQADGRKKKYCVEVFCRLCFNGGEKEPVCLKVVNDRTVALMSPKTSAPDHYGGIKETHYFFSKVFNEEVSQEELFERTALPLAQDLILGENGLFFTCGTASSDKTRTMIGTPEDCGVLPRCLDFIFNSIGDQQAMKYVFKSDKLNNFDIQNEEEAILDQRKEHNADLSSTPEPIKKGHPVDWTLRVPTDTKIDTSGSGMRYSLFVSYVEIYNNFIYDLLEDPLNTMRSKPFASKMIRVDYSHRMYIFNVNQVEVKAVDEALDLLQKGLSRRRVSSTGVNTALSRSHLVYTIRLVQAPLSILESMPLDTKSHLCVSQLSLVELATCGHSAVAENHSQRPKETGNISSSLLSLRNCIEAMKEAQDDSQFRFPFKESKLTYLFQMFFEGEGKIKFIVCANPKSKDHEEARQVLAFAERCEEIMIGRSTPVRTSCVASRTMGENLHAKKKGVDKFAEINLESFTDHATSFLDQDDTYTTSFREKIKRETERHEVELITSDEDLSPFTSTASTEISSLLGFPYKSYEIVLSELIQAQQCLKKHRETQKNDLYVRQSYFRENLIALGEEICSVKQQNSLLQMDLNAREQQVMKLEEVLCKAEHNSFVQEKKIEILEDTVRKLQSNISEKETEIMEGREDHENLKRHMEEKLTFEKERVRRTMEQKISDKQNEYERQIKATKRRVQLMKKILNEDESRDDEYSIDDSPASAHVMRRGSSESRMTKRNQETVKKNAGKNEDQGVENQQNSRKRCVKSKVDCGSPLEMFPKENGEAVSNKEIVECQPHPHQRIPASTVSKKQTVFAKSSTISTPRLYDLQSLRGNIPSVNLRHKRYHSSNKVLWVEHRPPNNLQLDTVLQPVMRRKKSVNKLEVSDITREASKYVLAHQEQNSKGEVETQLYKANVIQSQSGGAQVIFNDVEKLKQVSHSNYKNAVTKSNVGDACALPREEIVEKCALSYESHGF